MDIQAPQIDARAIGIDQAAIAKITVVSVDFGIDDGNVIGTVNFKHAAVQLAIIEFAVFKEHIAAALHIHAAHAAFVDIGAAYPDILAASQVDAPDAAAVEPGILNLHIAAGLHIEHAADAAPLLLGVAQGDVLDFQIGRIVKAQHVRIPWLCGNGDLVRLHTVDGQIGSVGNHQLAAIEGGLPVVVFPTGASVARSLGQIVFAGGQNNFRIRGDGGQEFIHRGHMDGIDAFRILGHVLRPGGNPGKQAGKHSNAHKQGESGFL